MDLKFFLGICAVVLLAGSFIPYFQGMVRGHTVPHSYTWLIWAITQSLAALAIYEGGGGALAAISVGLVAVMSLAVFVFSLRMSRSHLHIFDRLILIIALIATGVWWFFDHPVYAVFMIAFIDGIGFIPTYRKTYHAPETESLAPWILYLIGNLFALGALDVYNLLTTLYITTMIIASAILLMIILGRRQRYFDSDLF